MEVGEDRNKMEQCGHPEMTLLEIHHMRDKVGIQYTTLI